MKQKTISKRGTVACLACEVDVYVGFNPKIGSYVICNHCDAEFQITNLKPVMINWPDDDDFTDEDEAYYDDLYDIDDF
jgi:hypothetical protein